MLCKRFVAMLLPPLALLAGCGHDQSDERTAPAPLSAPSQPDGEKPVVTNYRLKGVVKRVESELEHVTIAHEAIPGFMDAMRMRFAYKEKTLLATLRPGDLVEGMLRVERALGAVRSYELRDLHVLQHAPAVPVVPDISRNKALAGNRAPAAVCGRTGPGLHHDQRGWTKGEALGSARSRRRAHVYLYTMPFTRLLSTHGQKVWRTRPADRRFSQAARQIRLISLSFDPEHDTPDVLKKHAQIRGATPPLWTYAVASHAELAKIGTPLGLFYQPGDTEIAHNLCTAVIDREGKLARLEIGTERNKWDSTDLRKTIYSLLPAAAK